MGYLCSSSFIDTRSNTEGDPKEKRHGSEHQGTGSHPHRRGGGVCRFSEGCLGVDTSQPPRGRKPRPGDLQEGAGGAQTFTGPGVARTWTQPAVLREPLQAVLQQHRDNPVQVGHLTGVVGRRGEQRGQCLCRTQAAWIRRTLAAVWTSAHLSPRPWG